jgi:tetratricopeptide (TPR) repeat protein
MIADNYYGDPERGSQILTDNQLQDPQRLAPGSVLLLRFDKKEWPLAQRRAAAMKPYNRGVGLLEHNDLAGAEREFRLALEIAPQFTNARYNLALVLSKRGRHEEAEDLLADLLSYRPQVPDFLFAFGHVLFLQARFTEAIAAFQKLLNLDPHHRRGTFGLARALQEGGFSQEAMAAWEAYLDLDNQSTWAESARRNLEKLQSESSPR